VVELDEVVEGVVEEVVAGVVEDVEVVGAVDVVAGDELVDDVATDVARAALVAGAFVVEPPQATVNTSNPATAADPTSARIVTSSLRGSTHIVLPTLPGRQGLRSPMSATL
jgi:hypothetical protein